MSTRRRLGTGPSTTRSMPTTETAPRLMPAERVEPDALLEEAERLQMPDPNGRRTLGPGSSGGSR